MAQAVKGTIFSIFIIGENSIFHTKKGEYAKMEIWLKSVAVYGMDLRLQGCCWGKVHYNAVKFQLAKHRTE